MKRDQFLKQVERFGAPSTILFRAVELKLLKEAFKPYDRGVVLDLGCGDGIAGGVLFDRPVDYGLDIDREALKIARKSGVYRKIITQKGSRFPLRDDSVNLVVSNCTFEHIKDIGTVLAECRRILAPRGKLVFTAPSHRFREETVFHRLKLTAPGNFYAKMRDRKLSHFNCHSQEKWAEILRKAGLKWIDGYYYLTPAIARNWDLLFLVNPLFGLAARVNPKWRERLYRVFVKNAVIKAYNEAKPLKSRGAAVCVIAQKDEN